MGYSSPTHEFSPGQRRPISAHREVHPSTVGSYSCDPSRLVTLRFSYFRFYILGLNWPNNPAHMYNAVKFIPEQFFCLGTISVVLLRTTPYYYNLYFGKKFITIFNCNILGFNHVCAFSGRRRSRRHLDACSDSSISRICRLIIRRCS